MCVCILMYLGVCVFVLMYVHMYVRTYVCTYMCVCMYVCMHVCMYICMDRNRFSIMLFVNVSAFRLNTGVTRVECNVEFKVICEFNVRIFSLQLARATRKLTGRQAHFGGMPLLMDASIS